MKTTTAGKKTMIVTPGKAIAPRKVKKSHVNKYEIACHRIYSPTHL